MGGRDTRTKHGQAVAKNLRAYGKAKGSFLLQLNMTVTDWERGSFFGMHKVPIITGSSHHA
jgi:hypothetical protein